MKKQIITFDSDKALFNNIIQVYTKDLIDGDCKEQIITFDFDSTLSRKIIKSYVEDLISRGYEIHIVTSRLESGSGLPVDNTDIFTVARRLGIPLSRIHFTNLNYKAPTIKKLNSIIHFDDNPDEIDLINSTTACRAISVWGVLKWKAKLEKYLECRTGATIVNYEV